MAQQITPISIYIISSYMWGLSYQFFLDFVSGKTHTSARAGAIYVGNTPVPSQNGRALF